MGFGGSAGIPSRSKRAIAGETGEGFPTVDENSELSRSGVGEFIKTLVLALILAVLLRTFVVESYQVQGVSMQPTLHTGERVLVDKLLFRFTSPKPGEIVVFKSPVNPSQTWIKRVIAVAGDTVQVKNDVVYVNGQRQSEPYLVYRGSPNVGPLTVKPGDIWVEGDNRPQSYDSRYFGQLPVKNLRGEAFLVWWPLNNLHWF